MMTSRLYRKAFLSIIICMIVFVSVPFKAYAGQFTLNPSKGSLIEGENFILDILIDSQNADLLQARAVITFDPSLVQIVKAQKNNSLFATYADADQTTDNENGVLMLTGFSQSGVDSLYTTKGEPDVFARVTFTAVKAGTVEFEWEYTGANEAFQSIMSADGSPPQNVLLSRPKAATFTISASGPYVAPITTQPNTGIADFGGAYVGGAVFLGGILLSLGMVLYYKASGKIISSDKKTIVLLED